MLAALATNVALSAVVLKACAQRSPKQGGTAGERIAGSAEAPAMNRKRGGQNPHIFFRP